MKIVIIDYGSGNIQSILFALQRLGHKATVTNNSIIIKNADKVIFPGVGQASSAMLKLQEFGVDQLIPKLRQPVLGICLGMQLLCNHTEEGNTKGLCIFDLNVVRFSGQLKIPQIGWNTIYNLKSPLFEGIHEKEYVYLVHSYYVPFCEEAIALTDYGRIYASALQKDNFYGVQFHPEKSSTAGDKILTNFLKL